MLRSYITGGGSVRTVPIREEYVRRLSEPDIVFDDGRGIDIIELKNPDMIPEVGICVQHEQRLIEFEFDTSELINYDGNKEAIAMTMARRECPEGFFLVGNIEFYRDDETGKAMARVVAHKWNQVRGA